MFNVTNAPDLARCFVAAVNVWAKSKNASKRQCVEVKKCVEVRNALTFMSMLLNIAAPQLCNRRRVFFCRRTVFDIEAHSTAGQLSLVGRYIWCIHNKGWPCEPRSVPRKKVATQIFVFFSECLSEKKLTTRSAVQRWRNVTRFRPQTHSWPGEKAEIYHQVPTYVFGVTWIF
jgi:hypothetical protein